MGSKFAMAHVCIILALAPTWIVHAAEPPPDEPPVARYNEAVSLIAQGDATHGAAILDAIGNADAAGPASLALRDQANITLGYYFLRQRNGSAAIPVFSRVRSVGPYANRGLLGLGWAYLAPQGAGAQQAAVIDGASSSSQRIGVVLRPRLTADIEKLRRNQPFRLRQATGDDELALRRALVPWVELTGRDPIDPAVQEGMLAIAYSLNHLGAYEDARERYAKAADLLEQVRGWLDQALLHVSSGRMVSAIAAGRSSDERWPWWTADLPSRHWWRDGLPGEPVPNPPDTFYFERLLATADFQELAASYRESAVPNDAPERLALRQRLEDIATSELQREKERTERYLAEARFTLARIYDRPETDVVR